jgi:processive rubber oxygenase RoxA-like protein
VFVRIERSRAPALGAQGPVPARKPVLVMAALAVLLLVGVAAVLWASRDVPESHTDMAAQFKYGSVGGEDLAGVPYWIWRVLPLVFPEYLPDRPGEGYARLGFIFEPGTLDRPIGISERDKPITRVGLNCAACHTGTIRDSPDAPPRVVLGMPAQGLNAEGYLRFLFNAARDPRFNSDVLLAAIRQVNPGFSWWEGLVYQYVAIPMTRDELLRTAGHYSWIGRRTGLGPGRIDAFDQYRTAFGLPTDEAIGPSDFPSVWNLRQRTGMQLHWDGSTDSLDEASRSVILGMGASSASLDDASVDRLKGWLLDLQPPPFPRDRLNPERVQAGQVIYQTQCSACHAADGPLVGKVTPLQEIGTDPGRLQSFSPPLADAMDTLGDGHVWKFSHFRKTDGYVNVPLDGIWLRAPYLHNGSVPTLRDLLNAPDQRPTTFIRGYDVYDYAAGGFVASGHNAERVGWRYDTRLQGNGNQGHLYGTQLGPDDKAALLEYLKTL